MPYVFKELGLPAVLPAEMLNFQTHTVSTSVTGIGKGFRAADHSLLQRLLPQHL